MCLTQSTSEADYYTKTQLICYKKVTKSYKHNCVFGGIKISKGGKNLKIGYFMLILGNNSFNGKNFSQVKH